MNNWLGVEKLFFKKLNKVNNIYLKILKEDELFDVEKLKVKIFGPTLSLVL